MGVVDRRAASRRLRAALVALLAVLAAPVAAACETCGFSCAGSLQSEPTIAPQQHDGTVGYSTGVPCFDWQFAVRAGSTYEFSTCPLGEPGFELLLELVDPLLTCDHALAVGEPCSPGANGATVTWTAPFDGGVLLRATSAGVGGGAVLLRSRVLVQGCLSCGDGAPGLLPDDPCECVRGTLTPACPEQAWRWRGAELRLGSGGADDCPASATSVMAAGLELLDDACAGSLGVDDDSRATGGRLRVATPAGGGRLVVRSADGALEPYFLCGLRDACSLAPVTVTPPCSATRVGACSRSQAFRLAVPAGASLPVHYDWSIEPPRGASVTPSAGSVLSSPTGVATFSTHLGGLGVYRITVVATNACGTWSGVAIHRLLDGAPPRIVAPGPLVLERPTPLPPPVTPPARDDCEPNVQVAYAQDERPGRCPSERVYRRTWTATDSAGNSTRAVQNILVRDTRPPVPTPDLTIRQCAWPANDGRACFAIEELSPVATDACTPNIRWIVSRITHSEEALGACDPPDGHPDVEFAPGASTFCIRAERCVDDPAVSPGRLYTVEAIAVDECGNAAPAIPVGRILVPQDSAVPAGCRVPVPW